MRYAFLIFSFVILPIAAFAVEAPSAQTPLHPHEVLRGQFIEQRQMKDANTPMSSSGQFLVAPGRGLIWNIQKPFPTSTVITPNGMIQDIGGLAMKLPAKNLRHLYEMVGGVLSGDWSGLDTDFIVTAKGNADHWHMVLTPRENTTTKLTYATIAVSGSHFVENIVMIKTDGTSDSFAFSQEALSPDQLMPAETKLFSEASQ